MKAFGFSNGCAELVLKKPPPLVPSSLIASCEATGPIAIVCVMPLIPCAETKWAMFAIEPCETSTSALMKEIGSRT